MSIAMRKRVAVWSVAALACLLIAAVAPAGKSSLVHVGLDGKLVYAPDAQGNTIPDFSNCGYMGGGVAIPEAAVTQANGKVFRLTRLGARHGKRTADGLNAWSNFAFFDGHVELKETRPMQLVDGLELRENSGTILFLSAQNPTQP